MDSSTQDSKGYVYETASEENNCMSCVMILLFIDL